MSAASILESVPHPQVGSPFLNRLPVDVRLMVYLLVFVGSNVSALLDREFTKTRLGRPWDHMFFREGQCCFHHRRGSFALLVTCRRVYAEAFPTYWSSAILHILRNGYRQVDGGCELQQACAYLPAPIKENVRHIRDVRLPVIGYARPACDESNWAPTLLRDFPKLRTLAMPHSGLRRLAAAAGGLETDLLTRDQKLTHFYSDLAPFKVKTGEVPAAFLERMTGIQQSSGVIILSFSEEWLPYDDRNPWNNPVRTVSPLST